MVRFIHGGVVETLGMAGTPYIWTRPTEWGRVEERGLREEAARSDLARSVDGREGDGEMQGRVGSKALGSTPGKDLDEEARSRRTPLCRVRSSHWRYSFSNIAWSCCQYRAGNN